MLKLKLLMKEMDVKTRCESTNKLRFPVIATLAGVLGGTYGIGGGMLISPILLQIGISPQVSIFFPFLSTELTNFTSLTALLYYLCSGNSSYLFIHGILFINNVSCSVLDVGHGAHIQRPRLRYHLLCCITCGIDGGAESDQETWESLFDCVLSGHCDDFKHSANDQLWSH